MACVRERGRERGEESVGICVEGKDVSRLWRLGLGVDCAMRHVP